jgi:hypothetical protein
VAKKWVTKRARPSKRGTTVANASPVSLPPSGSDDATPASTSDVSTVPAVVPKEDKPWWYRPRTSKTYEDAMKVLAMRTVGCSTETIAEALKCSHQNVHNLVQLAGKNGWMTEQLANAKDVVEYQIMPKVLREIEAGLDDAHRNEKTGMQVKTLVAMKVAENTVFKSFDQVQAGAAVNNGISITITMPPGPPQQVREGTVSGAPAYVDGEVLHVESGE